MPFFIFFAALLVVIAWSFVVSAIATGILIWSSNEIFSFDMPFWPVFWALFVLSVLFGRTTASSSKS